MRIYFAFPDRAYHYDCARCDALCCRGHGIGTAARETPALLARYPELAYTATKAGASGANFTNPAGGCFFLTEENLCRVEKEHGREAKPGVCTLFPFNDFSRLGDVLVVRPHFLCPLRLAPGEGAGDHAALEKQLHETGVLARALAQPGLDMPPEEAEAVVRREEAFRDACGAAIGTGSFDELLEREAQEGRDFARWRERPLRLWGIPGEASARDYLDDILLALAPQLRMRLVRLPERQRLRVLSLAAAYLRGVARLSARPLTLQGAHQMIVSVLVVLRFLAYGNVPLRLPSAGVIEGVEFQNPRLTLAFFQVLEDLQNGRKSFEALEEALPSQVSGIERSIFFHQLARRVRELRKKSRDGGA